jgi:hypothetical protein
MRIEQFDLKPQVNRAGRISVVWSRCTASDMMHTASNVKTELNLRAVSSSSLWFQVSRSPLQRRGAFVNHCSSSSPVSPAPPPHCLVAPPHTPEAALKALQNSPPGDSPAGSI